MKPDMTADVHGSGPPLARFWRAEEIGEGAWSRNTHWSFPVTPLWADFEIGRHIAQGFKMGDAEFRDPWWAPERDSWRVIDGWVYQGSLPAVAPSPERVAAFEARLTSGHEHAVVGRWHARARPAFVRQVERLRGRDPEALSDAALLGHIRALSNGLTAWWGAHFVNLWAAAIIIGRWALLCRDRLGMADAEIGHLLAGTSAATSGPGTSLEEIAGRIVGDPPLRAAVEGPGAWSDPAVRRVLQPYLKAFGDRALEFEYALPTLREQPEWVLRALRAALSRVQAGGPSPRARVTAARDAELAALRRRLPDEVGRTELDRLYADALAAYALREDDVAFVSLGHGLMRFALLAAGRRFTARRILSRVEDIFHLRRDQLEDLLAGRLIPDLASLVSERHRAHERQRTAVPSRRLGGSAPAFDLPTLSPEARHVLEGAAWYFSRQGAPESETALSAHVVHGIGGSPGRYQGPARIVRTEADFDRTQPGDVLICPTTNPAWTVLFTIIGAVVAEHGGVLSHPAIAAREYGIPAVVNAPGILASVVDGQIVDVDGSSGEVRL